LRVSGELKPELSAVAAPIRIAEQDIQSAIALVIGESRSPLLRDKGV
jgi:DNA-binding IclR family transcriptional regulator